MVMEHEPFPGLLKHLPVNISRLMAAAYPPAMTILLTCGNGAAKDVVEKALIYWDIDHNSFLKACLESEQNYCHLKRFISSDRGLKISLAGYLTRDLQDSSSPVGLTQKMRGLLDGDSSVLEIARAHRRHVMLSQEMALILQQQPPL